jgi:hypothetical protein
MTTPTRPIVPDVLGEQSVLLDVPASNRSLRLIRLAAADAAADLGFDVDSVESARIAVDELAALLFDTGDWARLVLRFERDDGVLRVVGHVSGLRGDQRPLQVDRVVEDLLGTCVLDHRVEDGGQPDGPPAADGPWFTCSIGRRPDR